MHLLEAGIVGREHPNAGHGVVSCRLEDLGDAEVEQFGLAFRGNQNVGGLQIEVQQLAAVDFLQTVESAPTRITYPAKVKKANLQAFLEEWNAKEGTEETIKVAGKDIKCKVKSSAHKVEGGTVEAKICFSETVPGGVVLHTRTTKDGTALVAETTTALKSFAQAGTDK